MRAALCLALALFVAPVARAAETDADEAEASTEAPGHQYRVERLSFAGLPAGDAERELERRLNRLALQGWELDQVLAWSEDAAVIVLRR